MFQLRSVPVDVENFTATGGTKSLALTWDALIPSDSSDQESWEITYGPTSGMRKMLNIPKSNSSYTLLALQTGVEYTITLNFVGFDDLRSDGITTTGTPS